MSLMHPCLPALSGNFPLTHSANFSKLPPRQINNQNKTKTLWLTLTFP